VVKCSKQIIFAASDAQFTSFSYSEGCATRAFLIFLHFSSPCSYKTLCIYDGKKLISARNECRKERAGEKINLHKIMAAMKKEENFSHAMTKFFNRKLN
jgi:hypothetical protein